MAKRLTRVTEKRQNNWYQIHRKSIEDDSVIYEPFWRTDDISSLGVKTKIPHFKTKNRLVHLLSQNELWMYLHLIRNPLVIEVYEQYALPLEITEALAKHFEIKHPVYPDSRVPIIQTIDFIVDMINPESGEIYKAAFPVKQSEDALRIRTTEKLVLQEAFCELEHIDYQLVTSGTLRTVYSENLEALHRHRLISPFLKSTFQCWLSNFFGYLSDNRHECVANIIEQASLITGNDYQMGVTFFYHSLWHKLIHINWNKRLKLEFPASDMGIYSNA